MTTLSNIPADLNRERMLGTSTLGNVPTYFSRERLLDTEQTAEFLGFSVSHFRRLYRARKVPAPITIGERKYGWRLGGLIDFVASKSGGAQ
jgi:predicted DNA-binding transcriptional regulator AlpA